MTPGYKAIKAVCSLCIAIILLCIALSWLSDALSRNIGAIILLVAIVGGGLTLKTLVKRRYGSGRRY